ncbi:MAG: hypothetical protein A2378_01100 [Candidatus Pacebacteria bacterium RIFOXYB1_FULL_44_10]|nr:MAG: hypothetical protein A2378_01100 [Candidatus Pacebacteria bacterium RIFOXYB1_FULL_44_10]
MPTISNTTDNVTTAANQQERLVLSGWIVGFVDGEGYFGVSVCRNTSTRYGKQILPEFVVTQSIKSLSSLQQIQKFFKCGRIYVNHRHDNHHDDIYRYCVRNLEELHQIIIPFFRTYALQTSKRNDFELFDQVVSRMICKVHYSIEGMDNLITYIHQSKTRILNDYTHNTRPNA